ncbi:hypothetical protein VP01_166g9 [Puccinia sorghi]|uniref:N-acetyltransferase domain-containing protein n=1 Tax=Puccinia sorghi TaxID=27349 RepID=A0A0L6VGP8_9BASI|nr:hypothetical protein VP01_166g9 [Puccinia sorghi]
MAAPPAGFIRAYRHGSDQKYLSLLVGTTILCRTAAANQALFWRNPLVYLWTILFTIYQAIHHQQDHHHLHQQQLSLLSSILIRLPFLFAPPLILLVLLNRANRNYFHHILVNTLARPDLRDPVRYYSRPPSLGDHKEESCVQSAIWVLDYDGRQLGIIALDLNLDGYQEELLGPVNQTILVRHLASAPDFRAAGIDQELLAHACRLAFQPGSSLTRIVISVPTPLDPSLQTALIHLGFHPIRTAPNLADSPSKVQHTFRNTLLTYLGFPDCHLIWPEQIWVLHRHSFSSDAAE